MVTRVGVPPMVDGSASAGYAVKLRWGSPAIYPGGCKACCTGLALPVLLHRQASTQEEPPG
jgi:hypothetical protein